MRKMMGVLGMVWVLAAPAAAAARVADFAWTQVKTSAGLQTAGRSVSVVFVPGPNNTVPTGARITRVHVSRNYAGSARIGTQVCWGAPTGRCATVRGAQHDTHAFDGLPAQGPLWLVYRVEGWGASRPPLFVRGTITVWFTEKLH